MRITKDTPVSSGLARLLRRAGVDVPAAPPKKRKYGNKRVTDPATGETFDSARELERWHELLILQRDGQIAQLQRQVRVQIRWPLDPPTAPPIAVAVIDFAYKDVTAGWRACFEDVKGYLNPRDPHARLFKLKATLIEKQTGTPVQIVR